VSRSRGVGRSVAVSIALAGAVVLARARYLRAGATDEEVALTLPGDQLVPHPSVTATRAVTVEASADDVWPWIAQIGQGRGGFYSYDRLENLFGCDIHSADEIVPAWQSPAVGDALHLHPEVSLRIAELEAGEALVLRGRIPMGRVAPPYDCTWAFVVRERTDDRSPLAICTAPSLGRSRDGGCVLECEVLGVDLDRRHGGAPGQRGVATSSSSTACAQIGAAP
jgi:hypothetical protein